MQYKYFSEEELSCSHCQENGMNDDFMQKVEALREELGFPFVVTSGYRCRSHPIEAPKFSAGAHSTGNALDIAVAGDEANRLLEGAFKAGFKGIGVNQKGDVRFIHLDNIEKGHGRPRPWVWSY